MFGALASPARSFFCALHPTQRPIWASSWARCIKPGGTLITMMWPVDPALDPNKGPAWPVTPDQYRAMLEPAGKACVP